MKGWCFCEPIKTLKLVLDAIELAPSPEITNFESFQLGNQASHWLAVIFQIRKAHWRFCILGQVFSAMQMEQFSLRHGHLTLTNFWCFSWIIEWQWKKVQNFSEKYFKRKIFAREWWKKLLKLFFREEIIKKKKNVEIRT